MNLKDKVIYYGKPAWIVGISHTEDMLLFLSRKPDSAKVDYSNVPAKNVRLA